MNLKLNFPEATVLSTLILTAGLTVGIRSLSNKTSPAKNYATINHNSGYSKLGIIYDEMIYSQAKVEFAGEIQSSGDINEVKNYINSVVPKNKTLETTFLLPGVKVTASTGIEWNGSRKNFKLETDSFSQISTNSEQINAAEIVKKFDEMLKENKNGRKNTSKSSLSFDVHPTPVQGNEWSSFLGKLLDLADDYIPSY